ncbi:hypothetical protein COO60DRAFT_423763 [Scenedesmus sp. NREL 46B-D3]|nr:hypothetical protein COO60DRAFT_423763 [Scenedesmus sp. NREL 46B-D3]
MSRLDNRGLSVFGAASVRLLQSSLNNITSIERQQQRPGKRRERDKPGQQQHGPDAERHPKRCRPSTGSQHYTDDGICGFGSSIYEQSNEQQQEEQQQQQQQQASHYAVIQRPHRMLVPQPRPEQQAQQSMGAFSTGTALPGLRAPQHAAVHGSVFTRLGKLTSGDEQQPAADTGAALHQPALKSTQAITAGAAATVTPAAAGVAAAATAAAAVQPLACTAFGEQKRPQQEEQGPPLAKQQQQQQQEHPGVVMERQQPHKDLARVQQLLERHARERQARRALKQQQQQLQQKAVRQTLEQQQLQRRVTEHAAQHTTQGQQRSHGLKPQQQQQQQQQQLQQPHMLQQPHTPQHKKQTPPCNASAIADALVGTGTAVAASDDRAAAAACGISAAGDAAAAAVGACMASWGPHAGAAAAAAAAAAAGGGGGGGGGCKSGSEPALVGVPADAPRSSSRAALQRQSSSDSSAGSHGRAQQREAQESKHQLLQRSPQQPSPSKQHTVESTQQPLQPLQEQEALHQQPNKAEPLQLHRQQVHQQHNQHQQQEQHQQLEQPQPHQEQLEGGSADQHAMPRCASIPLIARPSTISWCMPHRAAAPAATAVDAAAAAAAAAGKECFTAVAGAADAACVTAAAVAASRKHDAAPMQCEVTLPMVQQQQQHPCSSTTTARRDRPQYMDDQGPAQPMLCTHSCSQRNQPTPPPVSSPVAAPAAAATQVGRPTDRDWAVFCSNCRHLACEPPQQHSHGLPPLRHRRAKALTRRAKAMRAAADGALDDLECLAGLFARHVAVPDFSCTLQTPPGVLGAPVALTGTGPQGFAVTQQQLAGMLAGISYAHLEQPVKAVGGETAEARTSADLAASMLQSITQRNRYGQSNPVTAKLSEAAKAMRAGVSRLPGDASPVQQAAAAAAVAEVLAQQELAAAEQRQAAAAAAAEAFPQPNAQQRARATAADAAAAARALQGRRSTRGTEQQQQVSEQQRQPAACGRAVHYLNAFILLQLFSGEVGRSLTTCRGQVYDSILLLMGIAGTRTPGHIDPAAAITFAWPLLLAGEQWSEALMQQVLALWLFVSPSPEAWQRLLDWLMRRQQRQTQQQQAAAPAAIDAASAAAGDDAAAGQRQDQQSKAKQQQGTSAKPAHVAGDDAGAAPRQTDRSDRSSQQQQQQQMQSKPQLPPKQQQQQQQQQQHESAAVKPVSAKQLQEAAEQLLRGLDLQPAEVHDLARHLGQHAVLLRQRAGEAMSVEPGWKHWVFNQRPCFKVAFELLRPRQAAAIVHMQQRLRGKMVVQQVDYMRVGCSVVQQLQEWAAWCRRHWPTHPAAAPTAQLPAAATLVEG